MELVPSSIPVTIQGSRVRVAYGPGVLSHLGRYVREEGGANALIVTDRGIRDAGLVDRALASVEDAGVIATVFDGVEENPSTDIVEAGVCVAKECAADFLIGLGGGSSLDSAKGINFLLTNGGRMQDYWGTGKATQPMLPMIGVPTTAGTGSEAQSYALITDPETHRKMACGDEKAMCRVALLDPELTETVPRYVAVATGLDAISHAVETSATLRRTDRSRKNSREAYRRLSPFYAEALGDGAPEEARSAMLVGSHFAGIAIEESMLGGAHACANPLTAFFGITHGFAVSLMLPHIVRFNCAMGDNPYSDLEDDPEQLANRILGFLDLAGLSPRLRDWGVTEDRIAGMATMGTSEWTGTHNPRPLKEADFVRLYETAF